MVHLSRGGILYIQTFAVVIDPVWTSYLQDVY